MNILIAINRWHLEVSKKMRPPLLNHSGTLSIKNINYLRNALAYSQYTSHSTYLQSIPMDSYPKLGTYDSNVTFISYYNKLSLSLSPQNSPHTNFKLLSQSKNLRVTYHYAYLPTSPLKNDCTTIFFSQFHDIPTNIQLLNYGGTRLKMVQSEPPAPHGAKEPLVPKYNENMQKTFEILHQHLPNLFTEVHPFQLYHNDIVFENNIKGYVLNGKSRYLMYMYWLRLVSPFKYAKVQFNILKMTLHEDTHTIKVRWQLKGVSNASAFFKLWKFRDRYDVVKDGFSTFILNKDGLITRHIMDKMMPDEDCKPVSNLKSGVLSAKLAVLIGLVVPHIYSPDD